MSGFESGLTTSFPRPEEVVSASREFDRGRRTAKDLALLFEKWSKEVVALETRAGLSWTTGGHLTSQDLFRPAVEASDGVVTGPLTRWYDTNTFFRQPVVEGRPKVRPGRLAAWFSQGQHGSAVILPGPWTFSRRAENRTSLGQEDFAKALAGLLGEAIAELSAGGAQRFILHEPEIVVHPPSASESALLERLYRPLGSALGRSENILWTYFADGAIVAPVLAKLPVGGIGFDLSDTSPDALKTWDSGLKLGLGCLDARTSLPEDPKEIVAIAQTLQKRLKPRAIVLGPGVPLDLLPWEAARKKVEVLSEAQRLGGGTR